MMTQGSVGGQLVGAQESLLRLTQIIKPELVAQVLSACKKNQTRRANLDFETTLWIVLAMGILKKLGDCPRVFSMLSICLSKGLTALVASIVRRVLV